MILLVVEDDDGVVLDPDVVVVVSCCVRILLKVNILLFLDYPSWLLFSLLILPSAWLNPWA